MIVRAADPDLWRNVGWDEDPNHFLDFGVKEYGEYPFAALPRELGAAVEKFGLETLRRNGMLPWRAAEMFGDLRRTFEGFKRGSRPTALRTPCCTRGALVHYMQDANQPLHATMNYDGLLTGNNGIHSRFERDLFERFEPASGDSSRRARTRSAQPRDAAFDALLASNQLVDAILKADTEAVAREGRLRRRLFREVVREGASDSRTAARRLRSRARASVIIGAWERRGPSGTGDRRRRDRSRESKKPQPDTAGRRSSNRRCSNGRRTASV